MSVPAPVGYVPNSTPLRTKRNFKALVLPDTDALDAPPDPKPTRPAPPLPGMKRRPPPLGEDNGVLDPTIPVASPIASARRSAIQASLTSTLAKLDIKLDIKNDDLKKLADLGQGNGGSVVKVEHLPTGMMMAKKIVLIDAKASVRKQILRELQIMHECRSEYIISCYGSYLADPNICICMEFMDKGSFDNIYRKIGAIDINVVCLVAHAVLEGLIYLYDTHRIIHRDIKPSNILCNSDGAIKLCDFGVSGELINSVANTFVGTSIYMSPERIQGAHYSVKSDVWSLGITLVELAIGRFPFCDVDDDDLSDLEDLAITQNHNRTPTHRDSFMISKKEKAKRMSRRKSKGVPNLTANSADPPSLSIIELMHQIVREPAPRLPPQFDEEAQEFVDTCLMKDPHERHSPRTLLEYRWMDDARDSTFDLKEWASTF
ncbi:kinase-like domain-containing protein [Panaeolus papilionaceus]|nr:kinase-like domain-containing protein [Panaeolus papilionaceus]